ncbi:MAG TPA: ketopantoate reductase family protein [Candidatus Omnitrophota bacterium]|nr:ketopantoate reductase family protein [Candidatus Omnitrophota bacterium]
MNILIFGAGAVGSIFGGFLSRTEHRITLYGRPWHLRRVKKQGLRIEGIWGRHVFRKFGTVTDFSALKKNASRFDLILLTVKSPDTEKACRELGQIVSPGTLILSLQNGIGNVECLHRYFPSRNVLAGRVIFGAVIDPGKVRVTVSADAVRIGETAVRKITPRVKKLTALLTRAGIQSGAVADIRQFIWGKALYNCALNPLASLLDVHYGALLENLHTRLLMKEIVAEIYRVARKRRIRLLQRTDADYVRLLFGRLIPATYAHHPSMLQDLRRGRRTEIDALNGAICRLGRESGVRTPVNEVLTGLVKARECCSAKEGKGLK